MNGGMTNSRGKDQEARGMYDFFEWCKAPPGGRPVRRWALLVLLGAVSGCGQQRVSSDPLPDIAKAVALRTATEAGPAATGAVAAVPKGEGWGALKGVFRLDGAPAALAPLSTGGKDAAVCGASVKNEALVVGPDGGIANVLVFARRVSRVFDGEGFNQPAEAIFDQKACLFLSHVMGLKVGDTMRIKNSDPIGHNTNMSPAGNPPSNVLLAGGGEATYQFIRQLPAPTAVTCNIHPWMKAYVIARDDPYFTVTGEDGSFEIAHLPAGEPVEFQVWHELAAEGLEAKSDWARGRFTVTIPKDGVEDLGEIKVPAARLR